MTHPFAAPSPTAARPFVRLLAGAAAALALSGCAVTTAVWDRERRAAPRSLPLTTGQPLEIHFQSLSSFSQSEVDLETWRKTGLFSSVSRAAKDEPSASGVFLRVACRDSGWESEAGFFSTMMWFMTLGTFPALHQTSTEVCKLTMYESAIEIASTEAVFGYQTLGNGWGMIPAWIGKQDRYKQHALDSAGIRVNNILAAVSKKK